jgi:hypothetical protein
LLRPLTTPSPSSVGVGNKGSLWEQLHEFELLCSTTAHSCGYSVEFHYWEGCYFTAAATKQHKTIFISKQCYLIVANSKANNPGAEATNVGNG